jgi:hypothetical protein
MELRGQNLPRRTTAVTAKPRDSHHAGTIQRMDSSPAESSDWDSLQQQVDDFLRRNRELLAEMDRRAAEREREMQLSLLRLEDARRTLRRAGILKPR